MARHILIIDDDPAVLGSLGADLRARGFRVSTARDSTDGHAVLETDPPDLVLLDLRLGTENGLDVLGDVRSRPSPPPVVMISGEGSIPDAVTAIRMGALDFIEKPLTGEQVTHRIRRALRDQDLERTNRDLRDQLGVDSGLIGTSEGIRKVIETIDMVAPTDARVLITGESGTGKELVARAVHDGSPRSGEPFVALNCSAIPQTLVESELFGHQKGAFTGATTTRRGVLELASGGTLFLDEIGDMPLEAQPKLLRTLEEGQVQRVGAETQVPVDVRVVAATHQDLRQAIADGRFREDLFHRLNVVTIHLPPLRERPDDLPGLSEHFLAHYARHYGRDPLTLAPDAIAALRHHPFTGNVRELRNLMERLTILCRTSPVTRTDLDAVGGRPARDMGWSPPPLEEGDGALRLTLRKVERELVLRCLQDTGWRMTEAARRLGLERSHLYRKVRDLGIEREDTPS